MLLHVPRTFAWAFRQNGATPPFAGRRRFQTYLTSDPVRREGRNGRQPRQTGIGFSSRFIDVAYLLAVGLSRILSYVGARHPRGGHSANARCEAQTRSPGSTAFELVTCRTAADPPENESVRYLLDEIRCKFPDYIKRLIPAEPEPGPTPPLIVSAEQVSVEKVLDQDSNIR